MPRGFWILILLALFGVLYSSHYFLYFSSVHFFGIEGRWGRRGLAAVLILLPVSFFVRVGGVRWYSLLSHLWLGVGLALVGFFALAWAAWSVAGLHNPRPAPIWFGLAAVALAGVYSAYGIWNAGHPKVQHVPVKLRNLPDQWRGRRLVQITDVHLGLILGPDFLEGVVDQVNAQNPDAICITGDLFESGEGGLDRFIAPLNRMRAPLGVYFITGNHETYLGVERALAVLKKTQVKVLDDEMVVVDGLQVLGISYPRSGFSRDLAAALRGIAGYDRSKPSVLLYHSPSQIPAVKAAGIGFQISGHTHRGQMIPFQLVTRMVFGKYHHGLHVEDGFTIYTSPGTGTWGPMMRTGNHPEITVFHLDPL